MSVHMQGLEVISAFQHLRYVGVLQVRNNDRLLSMDGLSGITEVTQSINILSNPQLCYILGNLSDTVYWQVGVKLYLSSVYNPLYVHPVITMYTST